MVVRRIKLIAPPPLDATSGKKEFGYGGVAAVVVEKLERDQRKGLASGAK